MSACRLCRWCLAAELHTICQLYIWCLATTAVHSPPVVSCSSTGVCRLELPSVVPLPTCGVRRLGIVKLSHHSAFVSFVSFNCRASLLYSITVPISSPITAFITLPSSAMAKTWIFMLLSLQRVAAVRSITFRSFSTTSMWVSLLNFTASL